MRNLTINRYEISEEKRKAKKAVAVYKASLPDHISDYNKERLAQGWLIDIYFRDKLEEWFGEEVPKV